MKKNVAKLKVVPKSKVSAKKVKAPAKDKVIELKSKVKKVELKKKTATTVPKQTEAPAPVKKVHPFAHFMKDSYQSRSFSAQTRKLGARESYRKKAV